MLVESATGRRGPKVGRRHTAAAYRRIRQQRENALQEYVPLTVIVENMTRSGPTTAAARLRHRVERAYLRGAEAAAEQAATWPDAGGSTSAQLLEKRLDRAASSAAQRFVGATMVNALFGKAIQRIIVTAGWLVAPYIVVIYGAEGYVPTVVGVASCLLIWAVGVAMMHRLSISQSWVKGLGASLLMLMVAGLARAAFIPDGTYFSAISPSKHVEDQIAVVALVEVALLGYQSLLLLSLPGLSGGGRFVQQQLVGHGFELLRLIESGVAAIPTLARRRRILLLMSQFADQLGSRQHLAYLRTNSPVADAVVHERIAQAVTRLRELQVWLALPGMQSVPGAGTQIAELLAALECGAYDHLPRPHGELPTLAVRSRVLLGVASAGNAVLPALLLLGAYWLGLRLPGPVAVAFFGLAFLWLVYWLAQAFKLDVTGFVSFAKDTVAAGKELGAIGKKADPPG